MIKTGELNTLKVARRAEQGYYLVDEKENDVLLPNNTTPEGLEFGEMIEVFIYRDSDDRIIATTEIPLVMAGEFACLEVVGTSQIGAFLDWGLMKDLFVPFREQKSRMQVGKSYVVYVFLDTESDRVVASSKIERFLNLASHQFESGQMVDLMIYEETDLGFKAIINKSHTGVLYENEIFQALRIGQKVEGFIKKIRDDGKIDLALQRPGQTYADSIVETLINKLKENKGFLAVTDKTQPEVIYAMFGFSKNNFKKAIGALYKKKLILIEDEGIRLISED
jgi:predicted RNA-binding protein (virulence factor B family)